MIISIVVTVWFWKLSMCEASNNQMTICLYGEAPGSIVDGPGIRYGVFTQGCTHHCPGCHNPKSQPHEGGKIVPVREVVEHILLASSCSGVTLSGGEPFQQAAACAAIAKASKNAGRNVWIYTGYLFEELIAMANGEDTQASNDFCNAKNATDIINLLNNVDVMVDGPFIKSKKSYDALYRGSTNQRLIDIRKTLASGEIVLWEQEFQVPDKPASW